MTGLLLSVFTACGLLVTGWQALSEKLPKDSTTGQLTSSSGAAKLQKEADLPLGLPRHEVIYRNIRQQALSVESGFFRKFANQDIWTILAEVKTGSTVVTLLAGVDGTVSLYRSTGQNNLGLGKNQAVQEAAQELFKTANKSMHQFVEAEDFPLPKEGEFVFYFYGPKGIQSGKIPDFDLDGNHPLYPLMAATNAVLNLTPQSR